MGKPIIWRACFDPDCPTMRWHDMPERWQGTADDYCPVCGSQSRYYTARVSAMPLDRLLAHIESWAKTGVPAPEATGASICSKHQTPDPDCRLCAVLVPVPASQPEPTDG